MLQFALDCVGLSENKVPATSHGLSTYIPDIVKSQSANQMMLFDQNDVYNVVPQL